LVYVKKAAILPQQLIFSNQIVQF